MSGLSVVIVVRSEHAPALRKWLGPDATVALFSDAEVRHALEVILEQRPRIVALDPAVARTAPGAALLARVTLDRHLGDVDLRILTQNGAKLPLILDQGPLTSPESALLNASHPVDSSGGTRRAMRFPMKRHVGVMVNGEHSQLVNLSATGAQLLVPTGLHPEQPLRLTLLDGSAETHLRGAVTWSVAEPAGAHVHYRAGVRFIDPDTHILEAFCARNQMPAARRSPTRRAGRRTAHAAPGDGRR